MQESMTASGRIWEPIEAEVVSSLRRVDPVAVRALRDLFAASEPRYFFTGQGRSGFIAQMGAMRLMQVGRRAHVVGEATAPAFCAGDVLVVVSGSGSTPASLLHAQQASRLGGRIVCLTAVPDSPIGVLSKPCVRVPTQGTGQLPGVLFTQVAMLLLDGVILDLGGRDFAVQQGNHANLQ